MFLIKILAPKIIHNSEEMVVNAIFNKLACSIFFEKGMLHKVAATNIPNIVPTLNSNRYNNPIVGLIICIITSKTNSPLPASPCINPTP
jgi:hypothetical protein